MLEVKIGQVIVPDYRVPFFKALDEALEGKLTVVAGAVDFAETTRTVSAAEPFTQSVHNKFFFGRRLLWQSGLCKAVMKAPVLILGYNLRNVTGLVVLVVRAIAGRPTLVWGHARGWKKWALPIRKAALRLASGFIAYTETQQREIARAVPHLRTWAAPNAITRRDDCRFITRCPGEVNDVLFVGRLVAEKKPRLLLDAFALAVEEDVIPTSARLVFVGTGPERTCLQQSVARLGLVSRVMFTGHVGEIDKLREIFSTAVCSVSPGYVGLSAIQSFAFGVPMIVAREEPHSPEIEACIETQNTIFVPSDDAAVLGSALNGMFARKDWWVRRRDVIAQAIRERYTIEAMVEVFLKAINTTYAVE